MNYGWWLVRGTAKGKFGDCNNPSWLGESFWTNQDFLCNVTWGFWTLLMIHGCGSSRSCRTHLESQFFHRPTSTPEGGRGWSIYSICSLIFCHCSDRWSDDWVYPIAETEDWKLWLTNNIPGETFRELVGAKENWYWPICCRFLKPAIQ